MRFTTIVTAGILLLVPSTASGAAPTLLSVGQSAGHVTATWSLPPENEADLIEVSRSRAIDPDSEEGDFLNPSDLDSLSSAQTSWRSDDQFFPGTYYLHVAGSDDECDECPVWEWSAVQRVVIPGSTWNRFHRYTGRTSRRKPIDFTMSRYRMRNLRFNVRATCRAGGRSITRSANESVPGNVLTVRPNGSFYRVLHNTVSGIHVTLRIAGRFDGPDVEGTLRETGSGTASGVRVRCDSGIFSWSAGQ